MAETPELLTKKEAASFFSISQRTLQRWIKQGMPHLRITPRTTRILKDDAIRWAKERSAEVPNE